MFTGIVETVGRVAALEAHDATASGGGGTSLTIDGCAAVLGDARLGDSISVNGTCLTITALTAHSFKAGVAPETLRRTNLGGLAAGAPVNLERAVAAATRMGGHFVQGHVDTVAEIVRAHADGNARTFRLRPRDRAVLRHVVEKGYVALDGASLTVTAVDDGDNGDGPGAGAERGWWEVMLVAYTQERVVMGGKGVGDHVNVEVDMVGKYVDKSVRAYLEDRQQQQQAQAAQAAAGGHGEALPAATALERMVERVVDEKLKLKLKDGQGLDR